MKDRGCIPTHRMSSAEACRSTWIAIHDCFFDCPDRHRSRFGSAFLYAVTGAKSSILLPEVGKLEDCA
jgi:hypothetical protein